MLASAKMEPLPRMTLRINTPVPCDIYDSHGRMLIRRGLVLDSDHLQLLGGLALYRPATAEEPETSENASPERSQRKEQSPAQQPGAQVMEQLSREHAANGKAHEKRAHVRQVWQVDLTLTIQVRENDCLRQRQLQVRTEDLSAGGIAFISDRYVSPDTIIFSQFETLKGKPVLKGIVRSCIERGGGQFRVGVEFLGKE